MKKEIFLDLDSRIPEPYLTYIRERNGNFGKHFAGLLGGCYVGGFGNVAVGVEERFCVPAKAVTSYRNADLEIRGDDGLYGAVVEKEQHASKISFHPRVDMNARHPDFYSPRFAAAVQSVVLPGFSAFSKEEALIAFRRLGRGKRLKLPNMSDGDGQHVLEDEKHLVGLLAGMSEAEISLGGLIIEENLFGVSTVSVGFIAFEGLDFTLVAEQYDIKHNGRTKFGGGKARMFLGGCDEVRGLVGGDRELSRVLDMARVVYDAYGLLDPIISRGSVDILHGYSARGGEFLGVTDPTLRPGGFTPFEVLAIDHLMRNKGEVFVDGEVVLDYKPRGRVEDDEVVFLDQASLRITARLF